MITTTQQKALREQSVAYIEKSGFPVTPGEMDAIAVADFGLSSPTLQGAQILTLFATERISAKLIVLLPNQVLPEHWHPPVGDDPGKEEILRGHTGTVLYFEEGAENIDDSEVIPGKEHCFVSRSRIDLEPGVQVIIPPGKKHWMKGGPNGGCVLSFSTCVRDILDQFTDMNIVRTTVVVEG